VLKKNLELALFLKEYDLAAWRRKFQDNYTVMSIDGKLYSSYIHMLNEGINGIRIDGVTFDNKAFCNYVDESFHPCYHHVKTGWYNTCDGVLWIHRKTAKTFNIGVNDHSHSILRITGKSNFPDLVTDPCVSLSTALNRGGILSRLVYISPVGEIYYRNKIVGEIDGDKPLVANKFSFIQQEVLDAFRKAKQ
jgi:hypothetical protein